MSQAVHNIPARAPANLTLIKDIEEEHRFDISGYSLKDMKCDPYGHPIFACSDTKAGFVMCYDCEEQRMLRRIAPAQHSVDSVAFDSKFNFIIACDNGKQRIITKYNIKGDKLKTFKIDDCEKILGVICSCDDTIIASLRLSEHHSTIRVYRDSGEIISSLTKNTKGEQLFIKPVFLAVTGNRLIVGDVGLKNLAAYDLPEASSQPHENEKKPGDSKTKSANKEKESVDGESVSQTAGSAESAESADGSAELVVDSVWSIKMEIPRGLEVDGGGNICACDFRNNRLTLINRDGKILGHALTTVSRPQFVSINKNKLYIIDEGRGTSHRMTVYSLHKTHRKNRKKPNWQ